MKKNDDRTMPVNLQLAGKKCLVIGGGKASYHKIKSLIKANANLTVISPECTDTVAKLLPKFNFIQRGFVLDDITDELFLVIAGTPNEQLNRQIGMICKVNKILFSRLDSDWREGDFYRPASFTQNGFTIAISTGGKSCRKAKIMKSMLENEITLSGEFDCFIAILPKPMPTDDIKNELLALRGVTDIHTYYTAKSIIVSAIIVKNERLSVLLKKIITFYSSEGELFFGEDAFFHPIIKNIAIPETPCFSKTWIEARHSGSVLTYNKFIGKIK